MRKIVISKDDLFDLVITVILTIAALLCFLPFLNTLAVSFSSRVAADSGEVYFMPINPTLAAYNILLQDKNYFSSFFVSIKRVLLGVSINTLITILMAYPLSLEKKKFTRKGIFIWIIIFTMLFNGGLIPTYIVVTGLNLQNTLWALVLPSAVPVFNVILLLNFFKGIPNELSEAAYMDGAGPWYILFKIFIPLSLPALATLTLFQIVGHWNSFFDGLIYMSRPENYPLQTYIQQLVVAMKNISQFSDPKQLQRLSEISGRTLNASKIITSTIPILLIYPFLQKFFVHGIVLGAVKE